MYYPKECFSININKTILAKQEYEKQQNRMYQWINENYPDYYKMNCKEQWEIRDKYKKTILE